MTRFRAMQWGALAAGISFALTTLVMLSVSQGQGHGPAPTTSGSIVTTVPATPPNLRLTNDVRVYQDVKDAVVNITSSRIVQVRVSTGNDMFDRMLPPEQLPTRMVQGQSLGSGFVIHPSGYIITNEHVVEEALDVTCVFASGERLAAQVIATDNEHDLAVLKVIPPDGKPLKAIELGETEDLMIGEPVYAIGNPFGFAGTMTRGIVSAVDRDLDVSPTKKYTGLIQTDASINPGNSGGPLLNAYGQVIGVNTAIRQGAEGIGFAISVSRMRDLLPAFLNPEVLNRAQIGFTLDERRHATSPSDIDAQIVIKEVQEGSEAAAEGLHAGDIVKSIGASKPANVVDALVAIARLTPGDKLPLTVERGSKQLNMILAVAKAPPPPVEALLAAKMGIKGETLTPTLAVKYKTALAQGVYISSVDAGSPAATIQIQPGDVLIQLGRYRVNSTEDVATLLKSVKDPVHADIVIVRGNVLGRGNIELK